jgi:hypothetical protein
MHTLMKLLFAEARLELESLFPSPRLESYDLLALARINFAYLDACIEAKPFMRSYVAITF